MGERALQNRIMKLREIKAQQKALDEQAEKSADIACDYSFRLKSALESMKNQLSGCEVTEARA